jgi:aspartyl-tRNA(Asn)/glutamyl-tRNA(Gln) amidotransferase subunit C
MSSITKDTVKTIAHLARLGINEAEMAEYVENLGNIFNLVEQMDAVKVSNIAPMAHPLEMCQRLRPDAITETNQRAQLQKLTPFTEAGLYLVPQVIE